MGAPWRAPLFATSTCPSCPALQVPDPRGKTWAPYLQGHLKWWDAIYAAAGARGGGGTFSTTPEAGPPAYCWTSPLTDEPLVDVFDVNHYVGAQCAALYRNRFGVAAATLAML